MCKGKHLNFDVFKVNFENRDDWQDLLLDCAEFLIRSEIKSKQTWSNFGTSFFADYKELLYARWGYEPKNVNNHRLKVTDRVCFMAVVSALYQSGIIKASVRELAKEIFLQVDTGYRFSTLCRHVSDGWQEYDEILNVINKYKKIKSGK